MDQGARFIIVAAVDDSGSAAQVASVAGSFARGIAGAEVHLVHVLEGLEHPLAAVASRGGVSFGTARLEHGKELLERLGTTASAAGPYPVTGHLAVGVPWHEVVEVARHLGADLVVTGTHDWTGLRRLALGSSAEKIVHQAPCPVLVVRPKANVPPADVAARAAHDVAATFVLRP